MALSLVRSVILCTLINLCSCWLSAGKPRGGRETMAVTRDTVGFSVGPTASDSMLNPRRDMSPVMRDKRRAHSRRPMRKERASSVLLCRDDVIGSERTRGGRHAADGMTRRIARSGACRRAPRRRRDRSRRGNPRWTTPEPPSGRRSARGTRRLRADAARLRRACAQWPRRRRQGDRRAPIATRTRRRPQIGVSLELGLGVAPLVEELLPLMDHAEAVVHRRNLHGNAVGGGRRHLLHVHLKRAIARHAPRSPPGTLRRRRWRRETRTPSSPKPPLDKNVRGCSRSMNWFAHI